MREAAKHPPGVGAGEAPADDARRIEPSSSDSSPVNEPAAGVPSGASAPGGSGTYGETNPGDAGTKHPGPAETVIALVLEPKKLIEKTLAWSARLYDRHPRAFGLTAIGLLAVAMGARTFGVDLFTHVPRLSNVPPAVETLPIVRDVTAIADLSDGRDCVSAAKALSRKYVLLHVLQWVQYEDDPVARQRWVEQRIAYVVLPLVDIAESEQVFAEDYQGSGTVIRWHGPRRETAVPGTSRYQVSFAGKRGVPLTIVTGARMLFPLPFPAVRPAFRGTLQVGAQQDFWIYENMEDVICELTQIIDSRSLRLVPLGRGGSKIGTDGQRVESDVMLQPQAIPPLPNSALAGSWRLVLPGQDVGQVFSW
jgi:hypothetical protein